MWLKLFDFVAGFFRQFQCWMYVAQFDRVVILRKGIFHRVLEPGARGIIPMSVETAITVNVVPEPVYLDIQSLSTKDDHECNIQIGFTWRIVDPRTFTLDFEDTEDIVTMLTGGIVTEKVQATKRKDIKTKGFAKRLRKPFNRAVGKYGVVIDKVVMQDFSAGGAKRIWHEGISFGDGG